MRRSLATGFVAVALALAAEAADAATINFASLSQPGSGYTSYGSSVVVDGFVFSSTASAPGLVTWNLDDLNHPNDNSATSTALLEYYAGATTTIARQGGGTFGLGQIDLAPWGVGQGGGADFTVLFTGVRADASTVTQLLTVQIYTVGGRPQLQTGAFVGFTDLTSVSMTQGGWAAGGAYQFTNLEVNESVPDRGSTAALLGLGLLAVGWARARSSGILRSGRTITRAGSHQPCVCNGVFARSKRRFRLQSGSPRRRRQRESGLSSPTTPTPFRC